MIKRQNRQNLRQSSKYWDEDLKSSASASFNNPQTDLNQTQPFQRR